MTETSADPISDCLDGRLTPELAIARLLLSGEDADAILVRVTAARAPAATWHALQALAGDEAALRRLRRVIEEAGVEHAAPTTPEAIAAMFDRAVAVSPEASVAFYSMGDPARLRAATQEIVTWLHDSRLLGAGKDVLDLGCGIGRVAVSIAPHVRTVLGVDTSSLMVQEARQRCAGSRNIRIAASQGRDLAALASTSFDLILLVDSMPYLVQAGVADRHMRDAGRILRPGGAVVALNLAYARDGGRSLAHDWATRFGFTLDMPATSPFRLWDGLPFVFRLVT